MYQTNLEIMRSVVEMTRTLPRSSKIWQYTSDRELSVEEQNVIVQECRAFISSWTSHQRAVSAAVAVLENRVLVLSANIPDAEISGCGIDKWTRFMDTFASRYNFRWTTPLDVVYRSDQGEFRPVSRSEFRSQIDSGHISPGTEVFDLTAATLGELIDRGLVRRASESWHASFFETVPHVN
jgi:hypothetical protein